MQRQRFLESLGLKVLRFNDTDVKRDMDNVLMAIDGWIERMETTPYPPLIRGNKVRSALACINFLFDIAPFFL